MQSTTTMEPHQLAGLLQNPTTEEQLQSVVEHFDYVLPQLAASSSTHSFTCLPSASALEAHLSALQAEQQSLASNTARMEKELRQQLVSSLSSVQLLKERLSSLPEQISSTEDRLLELCEDLVISSATAPGASKNGSNTLMKRLDELHDAIAQLTKAKAYFTILAQAEDLRILAQKQDQAAQTRSTVTKTLTELDELVKQVERSAAKHGQAPQLVAFLRAQRATAFKQLSKARGSRLSEALTHSGWGGLPETKASPSVASLNFAQDERVKQTWSELCQLQDCAESIGLLARASAKLPTRTNTAAGNDGYQPLLATQILIEPLLLRFRYHFDGDRPTNRLDKPEWYLSHILSLIDSQAALFTPAVHSQPGSGGAVVRLCRHYANTDYPARRGYRHLDTYAELLHGFLTPLRRKLASSMPSLLDHPSLLAHTVFQALTFDADLVEKFPAALTVLSGSGVHKVSDDILANETWFQRWLEGEKEFALQRFESIMDSSDAWAIGSSDTLADDDEQVFETLADEGGRRTTKSARSIVQILDSVSERYRPLPSLQQRLSFLAIVQLPILRSYATRLTKSLDAFESLSSAFARAMPGEIAAVTGSVSGAHSGGGGDTDMVKGLRGLGRLLKALLSAQYVRAEVERWSETAFFVEMSDQLQSTESGRKLALGLRKDQDAEEDRELDAASLSMLLRRGLKRGAAVARPLATSTAATTGDGSGVAGIGTPAIGDIGTSQILADFGLYGVWEEPHRKFGQLVDRATHTIERLVTSEVLDQLRPYILHQRWDAEPEQEEQEQEQDQVDSGLQDLVPSSTLVPALSVFSMHMSHLATILDSEAMVPMYRRVANTLSSALVDRVVMSGGSRRFNYTGGLRLARDVQQGWLDVVSDISASHHSSGTPLFGRKPEAAWKQVRDACALLSLPHAGIKPASGSTQAEYTISKAAQIAFDVVDGQDDEHSQPVQAYRQMLGKLGHIDDTTLNVREVLRRRVEVWK